MSVRKKAVFDNIIKKYAISTFYEIVYFLTNISYNIQKISTLISN